MSALNRSKDIKSILIPLAIALLFLFWGYMIYSVVEDKGPGDWFYRSPKDVPGQSPFSTNRPQLSPGPVPEKIQEPIRPQHVDGGVSGESSVSQQEAVDENL